MSKEREPKLRPIGDHVVVRVDKAPDRVGKILLSDTAKQRPQKGEVLAVGPGRVQEQLVDVYDDDTAVAEQFRNHVRRESRLVPMQVKPGDVVWFAKWAGHEIKELGDDLFIMAEHDILAVVEK